MVNKSKSFNFNLVFFIFIFIYVFALSYYFSQYYTEYDGKIYSDLYESMIGLDLFEAYLNYQVKVSSFEPIHFLIVWASSNIGFSKLFLMSFSNSILAICLSLLFIKWRVNYFLIFLFVAFNFYILVLYFAAERLKFAFIFFIMFLLFSESRKKKYLFLLISIASHVQMLIFLLSYISGKLIKVFAFLKNRLSFKGLVPAIFIIIIIFFLQSQIIDKTLVYAEGLEGNFISNIWQSFIFLLVTVYYSNNKVEAFLQALTILLISFLIGPYRVVMMSYFLFIFYAIKNKRGINYPVLISSIYFSIKSLVFLKDILLNGHGF